MKARAVLAIPVIRLVLVAHDPMVTPVIIVSVSSSQPAKVEKGKTKTEKTAREMIIFLNIFYFLRRRIKNSIINLCAIQKTGIAKIK